MQNIRNPFYACYTEWISLLLYRDNPDLVGNKTLFFSEVRKKLKYFVLCFGESELTFLSESRKRRSSF